MKVKKKGKKNGAGDGIMKHGKAANKGRIWRILGLRW